MTESWKDVLGVLEFFVSKRVGTLLQTLLLLASLLASGRD